MGNEGRVVARVLVITDDPDLAVEVVRAARVGRGLLAEVVSATATVDAALAGGVRYDLVVLDLTLLLAETLVGRLVAVSRGPLLGLGGEELPLPLDHGALRAAVARILGETGRAGGVDVQTLRESLGAAVRKHRNSQDLTLGDVASAAGLSVAFLSQVELGKCSASTETLCRVCLALGLGMGELFRSARWE